MRLKYQTILAIGAHPDDVDFGCSATLAKFARSGSNIYILVCTNGARGSRKNRIHQHELIKNRQAEQQAAAKLISAKEVLFLDHEDGNLIADINFKEEIVKLIRKLKPDLVITHDPSWFYQIREDYSFINHNDHRETGIATLDALYPLARDLASFPQHEAEGLSPHVVQDVLLYGTTSPNYFVDIDQTLDIKLAAVKSHISQTDDPNQTEEWVKKRAADTGKMCGYKLAEGFMKLKLRP